ncbi:MAG: GNAT family N-acetyltransferase [Phaeodactylibacter sp.]|nr:GNAT family N-acetyltransferase [Phaeodactylibacter sp.]
MIQTTQHHHLPAVTRCHRAAFPASLASAMGRRYVTYMLSWYLSTDKTFLFHLEENGLCVGYCGGMIVDGTLPTGSASGMAQYSFRAAVRAFALRPWLAFHPEVRNKYTFIRKNIKRRLGRRQPPRPATEQRKLEREPHAGLVVIGVDPAFQGKGYGSLLLQEFERRALEDYGIHTLQLTVRADNEQAIRAYERNGWSRGEVRGGSGGMGKRVKVKG